MRLHVFPALLLLPAGERQACEPALFFPVLEVRVARKGPRDDKRDAAGRKHSVPPVGGRHAQRMKTRLRVVSDDRFQPGE